jgi:uncharacterized protein YydD (DUF2326 family)
MSVLDEMEAKRQEEIREINSAAEPNEQQTLLNNFKDNRLEYCLMQEEIERIKFVIRSYLRIRLAKVTFKFAHAHK